MARPDAITDEDGWSNDGSRSEAIGLPLLEHKNTCSDDHQKSSDVIPLEALFQVDDGEGTEYGQADDFLNGLQFSR